MSNLTPEKELEILTALKSKVEMVEGAENVIIDEPFIDSKHDEVEILTVENVDDELEIKYIKIDFLGFRDSLTDGCDDEPVVFVKYKIHVFQVYKEKRSDDSTSANDIKLLVLNLRNKFLETDNHARELVENCEHAPLALVQDIFLDVDELTGAYGHIADFSVEVECV